MRSIRCLQLGDEVFDVEVDRLRFDDRGQSFPKNRVVFDAQDSDGQSAAQGEYLIGLDLSRGLSSMPDGLICP